MSSKALDDASFAYEWLQLINNGLVLCYSFLLLVYFNDVCSIHGNRFYEGWIMLYVSLLWSLAKPFLPGCYIVASLLGKSKIPVYSICVLVLVSIFAGSVLQLVIAFMLIAGTNSEYFPNNPGNDPLYCCVYYATVPECSGMGPCDPIVVSADLHADPWVSRYLGYLWGFVAIESLLLAFTTMLVTLKNEWHTKRCGCCCPDLTALEKERDKKNNEDDDDDDEEEGGGEDKEHLFGGRSNRRGVYSSVILGGGNTVNAIEDREPVKIGERFDTKARGLFSKLKRITSGLLVEIISYPVNEIKKYYPTPDSNSNSKKKND